MTQATERALAVAGLRNLRDCGGLPTASGGAIRRGVLLRSEAPVGLPDAGVAALGELGLSTTVDLRARDQVEFTETSVPEGVRREFFVVRPPSDGRGNGLVEQIMDGRLVDYTVDQLTDLYIGFLDEQAPAFGTVIAHLAEPSNLPCLVHCHAGKDRTGLVIAMALELAGVAREVILEDYEATTFYRRYRRDEIAPTLEQTGTDWARVEPLFTAPAEALERALEHMGSARAYLTGPAGLDDATLDRLAALLVE